MDQPFRIEFQELGITGSVGGMRKGKSSVFKKTFLMAIYLLITRPTANHHIGLGF